MLAVLHDPAYLEAAAGALPMVTATLERALAGPVTVWSRNGVPAALHCPG